MNQNMAVPSEINRLHHTHQDERHPALVSWAALLEAAHSASLDVLPRLPIWNFVQSIHNSCLDNTWTKRPRVRRGCVDKLQLMNYHVLINNVKVVVPWIQWVDVVCHACLVRAKSAYSAGSVLFCSVLFYFVLFCSVPCRREPRHGCVAVRCKRGV